MLTARLLVEAPVPVLICRAELATPYWANCTPPLPPVIQKRLPSSVAAARMALPLKAVVTVELSTAPSTPTRAEPSTPRVGRADTAATVFGDAATGAVAPESSSGGGAASGDPQTSQ